MQTIVTTLTHAFIHRNNNNDCAIIFKKDNEAHFFKFDQDSMELEHTVLIDATKEEVAEYIHKTFGTIILDHGQSFKTDGPMADMLEETWGVEIGEDCPEKSSYFIK